MYFFPRSTSFPSAVATTSFPCWIDILLRTGQLVIAARFHFDARFALLGLTEASSDRCPDYTDAAFQTKSERFTESQEAGLSHCDVFFVDDALR
jgi:hypothetical protein